MKTLLALAIVLCSVFVVPFREIVMCIGFVAVLAAVSQSIINFLEI